MERDKRTPGSAADWLARAKGDLSLAKVSLPEGAYYEDLCYHAQQAAEKALKSVYRHSGIAFRYTHDLDDLVTGLRKNGITVPDGVADADQLSAYASESRYPGLNEPLTEDQYRFAVGLAEGVVLWAEAQIQGAD